MQMTNEEIVRDYKQASNKSKQVRILADLNQTSPSEILTILAQEGVEGVKMPDRVMPRKKPPETAAPSGLGRAAPARKAPTEPRKDLPSVYDRIETILAALPEDASDCTEEVAKNLVIALFREHLERRLGEGGAG